MILVTGASGQLGFDVVNELKSRNIPHIATGSKELDITNKDAVSDFFKTKKPTAVIHCAAYTAVDHAEEDEESCYAVNVSGTAHLVDEIEKISGKFLYISTDYVFSGEGDSFFETDDTTNPLGVYGKSKLLGEEKVATLEQSFILRVSWVFGENGNNFVKTMDRLGAEREELSVVSDQIGSPSYTVDLASLICDMIASQNYGIYHGTNEGLCSWAEFAEKIMEIQGYSCKINRISSEDYPTKAKRPKNSRLSKKKLEENNFSALPHWESALQRYLKNI